MKKIIYGFILLLIVLSCNKAREDFIDENSFEKIEKIEKGEIVFQYEYELDRINVCDSLIVIQTNNKDSLFKIYSLNEMKLIGSFGKKGHGPNEFHYPFYSGQYVKGPNNNISIWINDIFKYKMSLININKSIENQKTSIEIQHDINPSFDFTHYLLNFNDSIFIGNHGPNAINRSRFTTLNLRSQKITKTDLIPQIKNTDILNRSSMYKLYFDELGIKPDKTKLVSVMGHINRIDFYDTNLNLIKTVKDKNGGVVNNVKDIYNNNTSTLKDLKNYYYNIYCTDNFVYALHRKGQLDSENGKKDIKVDIRIFDWEGNPKYLLKMPNDLTSFSVDEKGGYIYGIDSYNESSYRYKINLIN